MTRWSQAVDATPWLKTFSAVRHAKLRRGGAYRSRWQVELFLKWINHHDQDVLRNLRNRQVAAHRRWMIPSYAVLLSAVTLRTWLPGIALDEAKRMNLSLPGLALAHQLNVALQP